MTKAAPVCFSVRPSDLFMLSAFDIRIWSFLRRHETRIPACQPRPPNLARCRPDARAGDRRRDAGPVYLGLRDAHFAGSAGAGGRFRTRKLHAGRRGECGAQFDRPGSFGGFARRDRKNSAFIATASCNISTAPPASRPALSRISNRSCAWTARRAPSSTRPSHNA